MSEKEKEEVSEETKRSLERATKEGSGHRQIEMMLEEYLDSNPEEGCCAEWQGFKPLKRD